MKMIRMPDLAQFSRIAPVRHVIFDSPHLRIISFNFEPGQEMPVHEHYSESELAFLVLEGEGIFIGEDIDFPIRAGMMQIMAVSEPHGFKATTRLSLLVFIAPPF